MPRRPDDIATPPAQTVSQPTGFPAATGAPWPRPGGGAADARRRFQHLLDLAAVLLGREIKVQYKTTALGVLWGFATPLLQLLVYSFLFRRVIPLDIPDYNLFLFAGLIAWSWFQGSLDQAARSITEQGDLVRQPGFPVMVLPVVSVAVHLVNLLLALPLLLGFVVFAGRPVRMTVLLLPVLLGLQFLLILGPAYLVGACNARFRDTARITQVLLQLLLFLTPVFYTTASVPERWRVVYRLNPMATLVDAYRDILLFGRPPAWASLAIVFAVSCGLLWVGHHTFERMKNRFVEDIE
jgi:lipopolysaccharide transport system permease protein